MMATHVTTLEDLPDPVMRRTTVAVTNDGSMMAEHDDGEYGHVATDETAARRGRSPVRLRVRHVPPHAIDMGFRYESIEFEAEFTIGIRGRMGVREETALPDGARLGDGNDRRRPRTAGRGRGRTEARCPVSNVLKDAGVSVETVWVAAERRA